MGKAEISRLLLMIFYTFLLALIIRRYFIFTAVIESDSMYPVLKKGDRILVFRIHRLKSIARGNVILFHSDEHDELFVKRIMGLPNDFVEIMRDGSITINGVKIEEPYIGSTSQFQGKFKVPDNKYFFLGDNRAFSKDSRFWIDPFIPETKIRGKAIMGIFPFKKIE